MEANFNFFFNLKFYVSLCLTYFCAKNLIISHSYPFIIWMWSHFHIFHWSLQCHNLNNLLQKTSTTMVRITYCHASWKFNGSGSATCSDYSWLIGLVRLWTFVCNIHFVIKYSLSPKDILMKNVIMQYVFITQKHCLLLFPSPAIRNKMISDKSYHLPIFNINTYIS